MEPRKGPISVRTDFAHDKSSSYNRVKKQSLSSMDLNGIKIGLASTIKKTGAGDPNADAKSSEAESSQATSTTTLSNSKPSQSSSKSSVSKSSTSSEESDVSNDSLYTSFITALSKPHKANDARWAAIQAAHVKEGNLTFNHFRLLKKLGCGDIGSVYLAELRGNSDCFFAMKVMDKGSLASRKKLLRAQTEREILQCLDHPFLPTLYTHFDTDKFSCLLMEFCSGGDLHMLRQRQPGKHFTEMAAKFYAAQVLLALEYLHMMGVIYRDLKPENVLVREDGHIMLSDFDLSLRCVVSPTLVKSAAAVADPRKGSAYCVQPACLEPACVAPVCVQPSCFMPKLLPSFRSKSKSKSKKKNELGNQVRPLPELIAEPTAARSLSFVGTHEYLAPEIIKGEGHGSAVDWWTFGIFLYELLHGKTPFKGAGNRATLFNVIGQSLKFPEAPSISYQARDLIRGLLVKDPQHRLAYKRGATEIKQHPFFEGVNWALIRSMSPPQVPKPFQLEVALSKASSGLASTEPKLVEGDSKSPGTYLDFEFF
ncbi:hypothetical protein L7F22_036489 [Adiantum nelumboides]|nr:hypothetical protein [Adiantum nelumboides]